MTGQEALLALVGMVLGGGGLSAINAARKVGPERSQIFISSAETVVKMSTSVAEALEKRLDEQEQRLADQEARFAAASRAATVALAECHAERRELRVERDAERASNAELRARIEVLEGEVAELLSAGRQVTHPKEDP